MDGFSEHIKALDELDVGVVAASADGLDDAKAMQAKLAFPVGHSVSRQTASTLGAWWESSREFVQPAEFVVRADGRIAASSYSDGPLGRMDAADTVKLVRFFESK